MRDLFCNFQTSCLFRPSKPTLDIPKVIIRISGPFGVSGSYILLNFLAGVAVCGPYLNTFHAQPLQSELKLSLQIVLKNNQLIRKHTARKLGQARMVYFVGKRMSLLYDRSEAMELHGS